MRSLTLILLATFAFMPACAGGKREAVPRIELEISVVTGPDEPARFELFCEPVGGTTPNPTGACDAIGDHPEMLTPPELIATCAGNEGTPPSVTVEGRADGKPVSFSVRECDAPAERASAARLWLEEVGLG